MYLIRARRGVWVAAGVVGVMLAGAASPAGAQQKDEKKQQDKFSKEERQEIQALVQLTDGAMQGKAAEAFPIAWHGDSMKGQEGRIYVPFTIAFDTAAVTTKRIGVYLRVVARTPAADAAEPKAEAQAKPAAQLYAYEDVWFADLKQPPAGQPYRLSRAFMVTAGEYDVYVAVRESNPAKGATPRAAVLRQNTTAPDYYNGELATSSIIIADSVEPLSKPVPADQQVEKPYALGSMEIVPATDEVFEKGQELSIIFMIYNPTLQDRKPDVNVEYKFHQRGADGSEKYFNRTPPTALNAQTLPPGFDLESGHQLVAGQSVPLGSFPDGQYRLEIEITDNLSKKTLTRDVLFTVQGS